MKPGKRLAIDTTASLVAAGRVPYRICNNRATTNGPTAREIRRRGRVNSCRWLLLSLRLVARLGGLVGRIEAGQRRPLLHLGKRPVLEPLLLGPELCHLFGERDGNDHRAVAVGHDDV